MSDVEFVLIGILGGALGGAGVWSIRRIIAWWRPSREEHAARRAMQETTAASADPDREGEALMAEARALLAKRVSARWVSRPVRVRLANGRYVEERRDVLLRTFLGEIVERTQQRGFWTGMRMRWDVVVDFPDLSNGRFDVHVPFEDGYWMRPNTQHGFDFVSTDGGRTWQLDDGQPLHLRAFAPR